MEDASEVERSVRPGLSLKAGVAPKSEEEEQQQRQQQQQQQRQQQ